MHTFGATTSAMLCAALLLSVNASAGYLGWQSYLTKKQEDAFNFEAGMYAEMSGAAAADLKICGRVVPTEYSRDGVVLGAIEYDLMDADQAELLTQKYDAMYKITSGSSLLPRKCDKDVLKHLDSSERLAANSLASMLKIRLRAKARELEALR